MSTALIFVFGLVITAIVVTALLLIGLMEASDPRQSRPEDLTRWEREAMKGKRDDLGELATGKVEAD